MSTKEKEIARLRNQLNPSIRGPNVDNILEALSTGDLHLINNVEAVNDQLYIVKASGQYLDQLLAGRNITRPENVGLSDEIFRALGIAVSTRKQVRDLIHEILRIMYGDEFVRATIQSTELETYALEDGDTLIISFDDQESVEVTFTSGQFSNIAAATAQEVADAITKEISKLGRRGAAIAQDDGVGGYVMLISKTNGPSSSIKVLGGKAQNKLKFQEIRPTSGISTTQWTLTQQSGGIIRAMWSGGPDPKIGVIRKNDYVNIYGTAFSSENRGTFTVKNVNGGLVNEAYVEWENYTGISETVLQGTVEGMLFFNPVRKTIISKPTYAAAYQTENGLLEIFIPATTKVVRRDRIGSAHLYESGASPVDQYGPYIYDTTKPYVVGGEECFTTVKVDANTNILVEVDDASNIPDITDKQGNLVFGFGTAREEGPVPYISRPSSTQLMINPSYNFKNEHPIGTNISLITQNYPYDVTTDGYDYPFYITDIISGRLYTQDLIDLISATGINVIVTVLYPNDIGLAKWGTQYSDKFYVWGE